MYIRNIQIEDFINYKKPAMFIGIGKCDWKCCKEGGFDTTMCQNSPLNNTQESFHSINELVRLYLDNNITKAIVFGGLEPLHDQYWKSVYNFIKYFREFSNDDVVIYTGYYPYEIAHILYHLSNFNNIILKFGRFVPNAQTKYDNVLGVELASDNQYGVYLQQNQHETIKALIHNNGYCPCMIKKNQNTKCNCLAFRNQQQGECHCGIFKK